MICNIIQVVIVDQSLSHVWLFVTPWTVAYQAPTSMEFSRQEYWSGFPFPSPGDWTQGLPLCRQMLYLLSHIQSNTIIGQSLNHVQLFAAPGFAACQASLSFTVSWGLLKLMFIESVMPSNNLILCLPLLLPSIFPSIRVFSNESALRIRWSKDWRFNFSISPSNDYSVLISFRIDWFDLLAVQGTFKTFLQQHYLKASILWCSAFFLV